MRPIEGTVTDPNMDRYMTDKTTKPVSLLTARARLTDAKEKFSKASRAFEDNPTVETCDAYLEAANALTQAYSVHKHRMETL